MQHRILFICAALWNWVIAAFTVVAPDFAYRLLMPIAAPPNQAMTWFLMGIVATWGLGYWWAAQDFETNRQVVRLAVIGKIVVFATGLSLTFAGQINLIFLAVTFGDFLFALLFVRALREKQVNPVPNGSKR